MVNRRRLAKFGERLVNAQGIYSGIRQAQRRQLLDKEGGVSGEGLPEDNMPTFTPEQLQRMQRECALRPNHVWNPSTYTCELIPPPPVLGSTNIGINPTAIRIPDVKPRVARRIS